MREQIVREHIKKWLEKRWKQAVREDEKYVDYRLVELYPRERISPDETWLVNIEAVECKGTGSGVHRAIGQCLDYYMEYGCIPLYLAVPADYTKLSSLDRIMGFYDLPLGILTVNEEGEISVRRKAVGKKRYFKRFWKGDHYTNRENYYQLRAV